MDFGSGTIHDNDFLKLCALGPNQINDIMVSCWSLCLPVVNEFGFHRAWTWAEMTDFRASCKKKSMTFGISRSMDPNPYSPTACNPALCPGA